MNAEETAIKCMGTLADVQEWISDHAEEPLAGVFFLAIPADMRESDGQMRTDVLATGKFGLLLPAIEAALRGLIEQPKARDW